VIQIRMEPGDEVTIARRDGMGEPARIWVEDPCVIGIDVDRRDYRITKGRREPQPRCRPELSLN